jgi:hypothetical protein
MKRATLLIALLALSVPALACMGYLVRTEYVASGVVCTYRLSTGEQVRVLYSNMGLCPICME